MPQQWQSVRQVRQVTMTPSPASFAPQVTAFFATNLKPNMVETKALWAKVVAAEPGLAKRFAADSHSCAQQLLSLVARLSPALVLRDGSSADEWRTVARNGKHSNKGGGKGKGPAKIFAQPNARASPTKGSGKGGNKGSGKGSAGLAGSVPNSFASLIKIPDCFAAPNGRQACASH